MNRYRTIYYIVWRDDMFPYMTRAERSCAVDRYINQGYELGVDFRLESELVSEDLFYDLF